MNEEFYTNSKQQIIQYEMLLQSAVRGDTNSSIPSDSTHTEITPDLRPQEPPNVEVPDLPPLPPIGEVPPDGEFQSDGMLCQNVCHFQDDSAYVMKKITAEIGKRRLSCSVENCTTQAFRKGMCRKHLKDHDPEAAAAAIKICSVENCTKSVQKKGMCRRHLNDHHPEERRHCSVENCTKSVQKKGMCRRHLKDHYPEAAAACIRICSVENCTKFRQKKGMCKRHLRDHHPEERHEPAAKKGKTVAGV